MPFIFFLLGRNMQQLFLSSALILLYYWVDIFIFHFLLAVLSGVFCNFWFFLWFRFWIWIRGLFILGWWNFEFLLCRSFLCRGWCRRIIYYQDDYPHNHYLCLMNLWSFCCQIWLVSHGLFWTFFSWRSSISYTLCSFNKLYHSTPLISWSSYYSKMTLDHQPSLLLRHLSPKQKLIYSI